jgi:predicted nuclease of predicted toxin-antitoxin system
LPEERVKFYVDQNLSPAIAAAGRDLGQDVTDWRTAGMAGASDAEQLAHAIDEGRCLVTLDQVDFLSLSAARRMTGEPHYGVLVIYSQLRRADTRRVAVALARFAAEHPSGMAPYAVAALRLE